MGQQYDRAFKLTVDGNTVAEMSGNPDTALRIRFKFHTRTVQTPNNIHVVVSNLSAKTAESLVKAKGQLVLEAGYVSGSGPIFKGDIYFAINGRESPTDTTLQLFARDGGQAYDYGVISKSLAKGSMPIDHFNTLADALKPFGITKGYAPTELLSTFKYPRGVVFAGMVREHLRTLADSHNCTWSIQNGALQMVPANGAVPGSPYVLNSSSGLLDMPTQTPGGIMIRCLINPNINLGAGNLVKVAQKDIQLAAISPNYGTGGSPDSVEAYKLPEIATDGIYKILEIETSGDSRGRDWYSDLSCVAHNSTFVPSNLIFNLRN